MHKRILLATLLLIATLISPASSYAARANYYGVVTRIAFFDTQGSFVVTVDTNAFDDCLYKYAYFKHDIVGQERLKMAYSMALTSLTTKMTMNFVIDKDNKGPSGECYVEGMVSGIRSYD